MNIETLEPNIEIQVYFKGQSLHRTNTKEIINKPFRKKMSSGNTYKQFLLLPYYVTKNQYIRKTGIQGDRDMF